MKALHVVRLKEGDQLEVKRIEKNLINACNFSLLMGGHVLMMMIKMVTKISAKEANKVIPKEIRIT